MSRDATQEMQPRVRRPDGNVTVRPVPEHCADAELEAVYRDLKTTFGVPWVGVITQAVAHYRPFFVEAWQQFQPSAASHYFESRCDAIRLCALEEVQNAFEVPPHDAQLRSFGYSDMEIADIRAVLDIFDYGNPKYLVLATAIQQSLCNDRRLGSKTVCSLRDRMPRPSIRQTGPIPVMVEEHHALGGLGSVYDDIKATLRLPFVNSDYKAMARWPRYLALAWGGLRSEIDSDAYQLIRQRLHAQALSVVEDLPYPFYVPKVRAIEVGLSDADACELMQVISLFQWLLPGLILNVTWFKQALAQRSNAK